VLHPIRARRQSGVALIIAMIVLVVMTLVVTTGFGISNNNLRAVSNQQFRDEAISAAHVAIEQVLSSPFTDAPVAESINVDINNDGTTDYVVAIAAPTCVKSQLISGGGSGGGSSSSIGPISSDSYLTTWDISATVTDAANGTQVTIHEGIRVVLSPAQYSTVCA
jgi:hypothetical protein